VLNIQFADLRIGELADYLEKNIPEIEFTCIQFVNSPIRQFDNS